MRQVLNVLSLTVAIAAGGAGAVVPAAASPVDPPGTRVALRASSGATVGEVSLTEVAGRTHVVVRATGLSPGFHGFHVHSAGQCDGSGATPFASAGGHWNPDGTAHGAHDGDLPPLYADASGRVRAGFVTDVLTIAALHDADGSALIVHAGPDNLAHVPARYTYTNPDGTTGTGADAVTKATGDAGARFACGVVPAGSNGFGESVATSRSREARAVLRTADGTTAGVVRFATVVDSPRPTEPGTPSTSPAPTTSRGVHVSADLSGLTPGLHGFHVHSVGSCDAAGGFTSAGGHLSSAGAEHGHHAGDLPPLLANADGRARAEFDTDAFTLAQVLDADGGAIVVHAAPDNLAHIPSRYSYPNADGTTGTGPDATTRATGDAGARVLCGAVVVPPPPGAVVVQPDVPVITAGNAPVLAVTVRDTAGAPAPDVAVELYAKRYGEAAYAPMLGGYTDEAGVLRVPVRPFTQTAYVARVAGLPDARTLIAVHARVVLAPTGVSSGGSLTFSGTLLPTYAGAAVGVAALTSDGRRVYVGETRTQADSSFSVVVRDYPGAVAYAIYTPARSGTRYGSARFRVR